VRPLLLAAVLVAAASTPPAAAGDAARGRALAEERGCGGCHGADGRSATPDVPSLAGQPADFITLQMILFRERLRDAPPMPDLAAFFAALPPGPAEDRGAPDGAVVAQGQALSQRMNCGVCHLPDYRGREQIPRLAGQREDYLLRTLREYRDNKRAGTDTSMNAVVYAVPDADLATLAHYLAHVP
jgi:cytochrome c553